MCIHWIKQTNMYSLITKHICKETNMCIHWITKHICKANEHVYSLDNKIQFVKQRNMCIHWITNHICKANEHVYSLDNKTQF